MRIFIATRERAVRLFRRAGVEKGARPLFSSYRTLAVLAQVLIEPVMQDHLMRRLGPAVAGQGHVEVEVSERSRAVVGVHARQRHDFQAERPAGFEGADDIWRAPGAADGDDEVA